MNSEYISFAVISISLAIFFALAAYLGRWFTLRSLKKAEEKFEKENDLLSTSEQEVDEEETEEEEEEDFPELEIGTHCRVLVDHRYWVRGHIVSLAGDLGAGAVGIIIRPLNDKKTFVVSYRLRIETLPPIGQFEGAPNPDGTNDEKPSPPDPSKLN